MIDRIKQRPPIINSKETGARLRYLIRQNKLSVKDIQNYLMLSSPQSIYHWLNGQCLPNIDNLYALSYLFNVPIDDIIMGDKNHHNIGSEEKAYRRLSLYYNRLNNLKAS